MLSFGVVQVTFHSPFQHFARGYSLAVGGGDSLSNEPGNSIDYAQQQCAAPRAHVAEYPNKHHGLFVMRDYNDEIS